MKKCGCSGTNPTPKARHQKYAGVPENRVFSPSIYLLNTPLGLCLGTDLVNMVDLDKIGTIEILSIRRSGGRFYLPLKKEIIDSFGLKLGDRLRVKIEGRIIPEKTADPEE